MDGFNVTGPMQCPGLAGSAHHAEVVEWLRAIADGATGREYAEMLLLIGIHFHGDNGALIASLVRATLAMHVQLHRESLGRMQAVFTTEVLPEAKVAVQAVGVPPTPALKEAADRYLPVHCVYRLLQGDVFARHDIAVKSWLFAQMRSCTTPVHSIMPEVLDVYADCLRDRLQQALETSAVANHLGKQAVFTESEVKAVFAAKADTPAQLLMVYFILGYNDRIATLNQTVAQFRSMCPGARLPSFHRLT